MKKKKKRVIVIFGNHFIFNYLHFLAYNDLATIIEKILEISFNWPRYLSFFTCEVFFFLNAPVDIFTGTTHD